MNFYAYEQLMNLLHKVYPSDGSGSGLTTPDIVRRLIAGGGAGLIACTVVGALPELRSQPRGSGNASCRS